MWVSIESIEKTDAPHLAFCRHNVPTVAGSHVTGGGLSLAQLDPDGRPVKLLPSRRILPPFLQAAKCKTTVPRHVWDRHRSDTHVLKKKYIQIPQHTLSWSSLQHFGDILAIHWLSQWIFLSPSHRWFVSVKGCRRIIAAVRMVLQAFRIQSREALCQTQDHWTVTPRAWGASWWR